MKIVYVLLILFGGGHIYSQNAVLPVYSCENPGVKAVTSGSSSSNFLQGIIPTCTVTVFLTGTTTKATIFKSSSGTPQNNPFTANTNGSIPPIYSSTGQAYDVVLSGGLPPNAYQSPVILTGLNAGGSGGGAIFPFPCLVFGTSSSTGRCGNASDIDALGILSNDTTGNAATSSMASMLGDQYYGNTLYIFGDSVAAGVGSDLYQNSFAGILQASHAGPTINISQGGNESTDVAINVIGTIAYDPTVTTGPPSILMPMGLNNYNGCGFTVDCQAIYTGSTNAAVAWAGMTPAQGNRVMASAMTVDGTFSTDSSDYVLPVVVSTTNGGVASWSITSTGNPIGVYYVVTNSNGGIMSCSVDSGSATTINLFPTSPAVIGPNHSYTFYRTELVAAAGSHTVSCTGTSATGAGNRVALLASDTIPVGASPTTLPKVIMTNVEGIDGSNGAGAIAFNALAASIESAFATQGLNIVLADINAGSNAYGINGYSPTNPECPTNSDPSSQSGGLHPNDCGHWGIAQEIIDAAPKSLIYNTGKESGAIQRLGVPVRSVLDYWTGNVGAGFSMTSLNAGGFSLFPGRVIDLGAFTGQRIEASSVGNPYTRITDGVCFANSVVGTQQSDYVPRECYNAGHHFFWTSDNALPTGNITQSVIHWWTISRENQILINNASPILPTNSDIAYVGPLASGISMELTRCNNDPSIAFSHNFRYELYRIGNDGFSVTFTLATGGIDTINGGTSYTWTASEPSKLELQCSETAVGGTYWYAVPYGGTAGSSGLSGMTAGQVPIAATANTVTSSKPIAGAGPGITTGPNSGVIAGDLALFTGTGGQITDGAIAGSSVVTLTGSQTLTNKSIDASQITGNLSNANLAIQTANTILGALTATTPSGLAVPSCSGATNALTWTTGTGFGCNTISAGSGTVTNVGGSTSGGFVVSIANPTTTPVISIATDGSHYLPTTTDQTNWNSKQAAGNYITSLTGDVTATGPGSVSSTVTRINGISLAGLTTGLLKNTTSTGIPSIAIAGTDYISPLVSSSYLSGAKQTFSPSSTSSGINIGGISSDPSSVSNGDIWLNTTSNTYNIRVAPGVTQSICTSTNGLCAGSGTVTTFSAGNLSPLFTTSVATPTSTPALSFVLSNAAAHTFLGNSTGSTASPAYSLIGASDVSPNEFITAGGAVNVLTATFSPAVTSLATGLDVSILPNLANTTTAPTLNVNGLGAKTITKYGGAALAAGDMSTTAIASLVYDGTNWELQNPQTFLIGALPVTTSGNGTFGNIISTGNVTITQTGTALTSGLNINNPGSTKNFNAAWDATPKFMISIGASNNGVITGLWNFAQSVASSGTVTSALGTAAITSATPAAGVTSVTCQTATCTVYGGTYTVVGGTATTGTFVTLLWPTTTTAWRCQANMNGGGSPSVGFLGIGHSVATATGMTLSTAVTILSTTFTFDYSCQP